MDKIDKQVENFKTVMWWIFSITAGLFIYFLMYLGIMAGLSTSSVPDGFIEVCDNGSLTPTMNTTPPRCHLEEKASRSKGFSSVIRRHMND